MSKFLDLHLADVPAPTDAIRAGLAPLLALPLYQHPNHGAQGSAGIVPSVSVHAYGLRHGIVEPGACDGIFRTFLDERQRWWGLGTSAAPEKYATDADGAPMLNDKGDPIKVSHFDAQHATLTNVLVIASCALDPKLRGRALKQAAEYVDWMWASPVSQLGNDQECNQRAQGWMKRAWAQWWEVTGDPRAVLAAHAITDRCRRLMGEDEHGPWITQNPPKSDHGYRLVCGWMTGTIGLGNEEWRRACGSIDVQLDVQFRRCAGYWLDNDCCDDWLPTPYDKGKVMDAFGFEAVCALGEQYVERVRPHWLAQDRFHPAKGWKPGNQALSIHNASLSIGLARWFGWRA